MRKYLLILPLLILAACAPTRSTPLPPSGKPCGDGVCNGPENASNCPADCPSTSLGTSPSVPPGISPSKVPGTGPSTTPGTSHAGEAPLFMTTMTHMEGGFDDDKNKAFFNQHVAQLTYGMDLADAYGAKLTVESEKPFAIANTTWNLNIMKQIVERGHGVGTHCDFGFRDALMAVDKYAKFFAENKALVDALVGAENNLGCSGGGGANDWALAASQAGFKYLDGIVGMHYLAMPLENRPDSTWTDDFIREDAYHFNAPVELYERIYPFGVANALDFLADPDPVIIVSSGEIGLLAGMAESVGEMGGGNCRPECVLTSEDVSALVAKIREIDRNRDRNRVAKLTIYLPANVFVAENEAVLREFFNQMKLLQDQGLITWATQKQVYEAYVAWNK